MRKLSQRSYSKYEISIPSLDIFTESNGYSKLQALTNALRRENRLYLKEEILSNYDIDEIVTWRRYARTKKEWDKYYEEKIEEDLRNRELEKEEELERRYSPDYVIYDDLSSEEYNERFGGKKKKKKKKKKSKPIQKRPDYGNSYWSKMFLTDV